MLWPAALIALVFATALPSASSPCGAGGGFRVPPRAQVVFSVEGSNDTVRVHMVVIARAQPNWYGTRGIAKMPANFAADPVRFGGGGTIDTLYVLYDNSTNSAWLGERQIPLPGEDNVVMVDRIDGVGGPMVVVGTARLAPYVSPICGTPTAPPRLDAELRARLDAIPSVHEFWK